MAEWRDDERLNETDASILELLENGRETTSSLADQLDKHPQTIRDRLRWLKEWDYVRTHHENTGLYEIKEGSTAPDDGN